MKGRITISLDGQIIEKVNEIKDKCGASISVTINRILKKEFKLK